MPRPIHGIEPGSVDNENTRILQQIHDESFIGRPTIS